MTFIKSWCTFSRRSQWGATPIRQNGLSMHAARRTYELDSCIPVSRPTMNYSVMSLPKARALCTPPITKIAGHLRLCAPP